MTTAQIRTFTAFGGSRRCTAGELPGVALAIKELQGRDPGLDCLIFDDQTGEQVDLNLTGTPQEVIERLLPAGRP